MTEAPKTTDAEMAALATGFLEGEKQGYKRGLVEVENLVADMERDLANSGALEQSVIAALLLTAIRAKIQENDG